MSRRPVSCSPSVSFESQRHHISGASPDRRGSLVPVGFLLRKLLTRLNNQNLKQLVDTAHEISLESAPRSAGRITRGAPCRDDHLDHNETLQLPMARVQACSASDAVLGA